MINKKRTVIEGRTLKIDNKMSVTFEGAIKEVREFPDCIVVRLDFEDFHSMYNVFAVDYDGNMLWQVGKLHENFKLFDYVGIHKDPQGNARLVNYDGFVITVEPKTGKWLKKEFMK
jgi:hypothetical protein